MIVGAFGKPFVKDARKEFGRALTVAETPEKNGKFALMVWRGGKTGTLDVSIPVMAKHRTKEGLEMAVDYLQNQKPHGAGPHTDAILKIIVNQYGGHAKPYIPQMEKIAAFHDKGIPDLQVSANPDVAAKIREAIKSIEKMPKPADKLTTIPDLCGRETSVK